MAPAIMEIPAETAAASIPRTAEEESRAWIVRLRGVGPERERAVAELHRLLLKAARFEVRRRAGMLAHLRGDDGEDLAQQSADDALVAVLGKLDDFRGESRFTTWAYKFALFEAAVKVRRRAWQDREIPFSDEAWSMISAGSAPTEAQAEYGELFAAIREEMDRCLSSRQRQLLIAVALNDVPIDVLSERFQTTRGALYKSLHDARRKLRSALAERGLGLETLGGDGP